MKSPFPRRGGAARSATLLAVVAALVLSGCATATAPAATVTTGCIGSALSEISPAADARAITGPATACLPDDEIAEPAEAPIPQLPVTVTDNQGTAVTVADASRILALDLSGTLAATVFALGLGDNVVGRDTSTGFAQAADLPVVTQGGHQLNAESILALAPTVVISDSSIGPWDVVLQLREAGIPVVIVTPERSIDNVDTIVTAVAAALGVPEAGATLTASLEAEIAATTARIAAAAPSDPADKLRIVFLYVRGTANVYYLFGAESGADALITSLGGIDVAAEAGITGMRPLTAEALVAAAPDVVLVMTKGLESVDGVDGLLERIPALAETPAGANRRVIDMADTAILSFGPRTPAVLDALAAALYAG